MNETKLTSVELNHIEKITKDVRYNFLSKKECQLVLDFLEYQKGHNQLNIDNTNFLRIMILKSKLEKRNVLNKNDKKLLNSLILLQKRIEKKKNKAFQNLILQSIIKSQIKLNIKSKIAVLFAVLFQLIIGGDMIC